MRTFIFALLFACSSALLLTGCSADAGPDEKKPTAKTDAPEENWQWEDGSSYDPGFIDRSKNPCPGPACDPPRLHPEWQVDPPPDDKSAQRIKNAGDPARPAAPTKDSSASVR
jgi:hypothetical protein